MKKLHPFPVVLLGAVIALVASTFGYSYSGSTVLFLSSCILSILVGMFVGNNWTIYPWQAALIGGIPSVAFLLWRLYSTTNPSETELNTTLFVFLPTVAIISTYFGALVGRWMAIKRKMKSTSN